MPINKQRTKIEMREDGPFQQEGFELMSAVFAVHNEIGGGLAEEVYQESLEIELSLQNIPFIAKRPLTTFYKGQALKRCYVPDFCVHDGIIVELKAVSQLLPEHESQLFNYMRLTNKRVGYLINLAPLKRADEKGENKRYAVEKCEKRVAVKNRGANEKGQEKRALAAAVAA